MDYNIAVIVSSYLAGFASLVVSLETLAVPSHYAEGGLSEWREVRTSRPFTLTPYAGCLFDLLYSSTGFSLIMYSRLFASLGLIGICAVSPRLLTVPALLLGLLFVCTGLFHLRNLHGLDGSDQMLIIVLFCLFIVRCFHDESAIVEL